MLDDAFELGSRFGQAAHVTRDGEHQLGRRTRAAPAHEQLAQRDGVALETGQSGDGVRGISLADGVTAIADGDNGIVKIKAPQRIPAADLAATLQSKTAKQVVDQGAPS